MNHMTTTRLPHAQARKEALVTLLGELELIRISLLDIEMTSSERWYALPPARHESARNLLHYIALRRHDLRGLQVRLSRLGLSSLGRSEPHVMASIDAVLALLYKLSSDVWHEWQHAAIDGAFERGRQLLQQRTHALLGPVQNGREARIMVTMPREAARDGRLVHDLLAQGMDCMRINCAHDSPAEWEAMIGHLRRAEAALEKSCRILMDLPGPKLRTGHLEPGPEVLRIHPGRDVFGHVIAPVRIWLRDENSEAEVPEEADVSLSVSGTWLARLAAGDSICLVDTADRDRCFHVLSVTPDGVWAQCSQTTFVKSGTVLEHRSTTLDTRDGFETEIRNIPPIEGALLLHVGDRLLIRADQNAGKQPTFDEEGKVVSPAEIGCTLPEVFGYVAVGEPVWLDDGKIGAVIEEKRGDGLLLRITSARAKGVRLRCDKGINFPDSRLHLPALSTLDKDYLRFVAAHADIVALSFANCEEDVRELLGEMHALGAKQLGVVLKIETRRGFENLPGMLLEAMQASSCGVMIARGDLAVEVGYQRMAEIQEEILWTCEAAHVPVIWATQVLETLVRDGIPTRAEITDAAMAQRAECIMLNKGPHILKALSYLDDIMRRMATHQDKKRPTMRELKLASVFDLSAG
ncbi:pyruvate kinase [Sideroxyarcus sp. TK5]